ncbi:hypothetical protein [Kribbella italica]|uniref:Uncharacterized protein n=1 Tax=Kribbella italica TaxID=1540520 RepID=A0A7W9J8G8_9ACTN|nr:hypothetical protein [Kribbella italica]MBB5837057.1 hypothetical protein [Kribbella italica]
MGLFSRKRRDAFDLGELGLPRVMPGVEERPAGNVVWRLSSCDDLARSAVPMSPFVMDVQGTPTVLVKLAGLTARESAELARAVAAGDSLLVAAYRSYPTYPVLVLALFVYDSPNDPLRFEGYRDLATVDVQDFAAGLDHTDGIGQVRLYDESAQLLATGQFGLRMPPFSSTSFPYRSTTQDLNRLWEICRLGAAWYHSLPPARRDFGTAVDAYISAEPPL